MNITRKDATITPTGDDSDFPGTFRVILSAPTLDRDGDTLMPEDWKTPLPDHITFDVDHEMSVRGTIGSGKPYINDAGQVPEAPEGVLIVDGTYSSLSLAQDTRTLVNEGHITKTSVAFMSTKETKDGKTAIKRELLNGAFVAIPSNREASVLMSKGIKAGARNSSSDAAKIQQIHDLTLELGAVADAVKAFLPAATKSVIGSLEATQDRARDALNDAYGTDAYVWLRATLPDTLIFEINIPDSSDSETYSQGYTDDGSVVTLTGERTAVDLAEIVKPDPDEDAEPAAHVDPAAAEKSPAAASTAKAADAPSEAVTDEDLEAKALAIYAAQFIN